MTTDRPLLGMGLMAMFCVLAPMGDSIAKLLGDTIPLGQLLIVRFAAQVLFIMPIIWWSGQKLLSSRRIMGFILLRTILHIIGMGAMFTSLRYLPLADAVSIAFVMPFIMLLLGKVVLSEEVGPRRLIGCAIGFIGTLLVVQPSFIAVGLPAMLPLLVALVFALFMLVTRIIAKDIDPMALQVSSGTMALTILFVLYAVGGRADIPAFYVVWPSSFELWVLIVFGAIGTLAHLFMSWSLRFAPSATLAPMQYLEIPFATSIGWVIFKDLPNGLAALGILITVGAGLYIVYREGKVQRANTQYQ